MSAVASPMLDAGYGWTRDATEVAAWIGRAAAGAQLVYAHGEGLARGGRLAEMVRRLIASGQATPHIRRASDGMFDFLLTRSAPSTVVRLAAPRRSGPSAEAMVLFDRIETCARLRHALPTYRSLAEELDLAGAESVRRLLRQLEAAGLVRVRMVGPIGAARPVVTIVETGRSTAEGPHG